MHLRVYFSAASCATRVYFCIFSFFGVEAHTCADLEAEENEVTLRMRDGWEASSTRRILIRPLETVTCRSFQVFKSPTFCFRWPCARE
jgi:hypothetical protein